MDKSWRMKYNYYSSALPNNYYNYNYSSSSHSHSHSHHHYHHQQQIKQGDCLGTSPVNAGDFQTADAGLSQRNCSRSTHPSISNSGCPRVFCFGKTGHLLLSNTGIIGILCSCHCFNMSISKFCEHSGLRDINPGEAVRMDSGETVSQWRKLYFQRLGIRVPDDHSGWDWPEGIISAGGGVRKSSGGFPNIAIDCTLAYSSGLPTDTMMPGLPLDSNSLPNNRYIEQIRNSHEIKQRDTNIQTVRCPISSSSTNCGYPFLSNTMDSNVKIGNLPKNQLSLQNHGEDSDIGRIKNPNDEASSNVELRLGQPYHQSRSTMNPVLSAVGLKGINGHVKPLKPLFSEQMIHNAKYREKESRQNILRAAVHSDAITMNILPMPKKLSFIPHAANSDLASGLGRGCQNTTKEVNVSELSLFQLTDKGKSIGCISNSSNIGTSMHKVQNQIENPSSFSGVVEPSLSAAHDKTAFSSQLPNKVPLDAFSVRLSDNFGSGGQFFRPTDSTKLPGQVFPSTPVLISFPTSNSICSPAVTQAVPKHDNNGVIPYFLDDNMRLLALGQLMELSKQQQAASFLGMNQKQRNANMHNSFVHLPISAKQKRVENLSCSLVASEIAVNSFPCGFTECVNSNSKTLAPLTGLNICRNSSKLTQGISYSTETDVQQQCFHDSVMNDWTTSRSEKIDSQLNGHENCSSRAPHNHAANATCLPGNYDSVAGICPNTFREWIGRPNSESSKPVALWSVEKGFLPEAETSLTEGQLGRNGVGHVPQWRDVPSKLQRISDVSADNISNNKEHGEGQVGNSSAKCYNNSGFQVDDSLKKQEVSFISSGCSTRTLTHGSNDVTNNNMDSSIVDDEDCGYASYSPVDEGSANDKCWSSDDLESDFTGSNKTDFKGHKSQSSRSILEELKLLDSLTWKKGRNQTHNIELLTCKKTGHSENFGGGAKIIERKKPMKSKSQSSSLGKMPSRQRDLYALYRDTAVKNNYGTGFGDYDNCCETSEDSGRKKCQRRGTYKTIRHFQVPETPDSDTDSAQNFNSLGYMNASSSQPSSFFYKKEKPVVYGSYGEISGVNLEEDNSKPVKYLSLSQIMQSTKKCVLKKSKPGSISPLELKKTYRGEIHSSCDKLSLKSLEEEGSHSSRYYDKMDVGLYDEEETNWAYIGEDKRFAHGVSESKKENDTHVQLKPKCKEIRKRCLYDLKLDGNTRNKYFPPMRKSKSNRKGKMIKVLQHNEEVLIQNQQCFSNVDPDAICCVCGSLDQHDFNCILKCSQCLIKVHQACYGVLKIPKGPWSCNPCKANAKDIVCVLCGYGGGAMSQASRSRAIAKTLLEAWNLKSKKNISSLSSALNGSLSVVKPINMEEPLNVGEIEMDEQNLEGSTLSCPCDIGNLKMPNSITAGMFNPTVKQWVHVVCGLWTPTTTCPNVATMKSFDVLKVISPGSDVVCSICNRPGGSSIQCSIPNCSVRFHPWCAHQTGLLQSEEEGFNNERVGFYARCASHATFPMCESYEDHMDMDDQTNYSGKKLTCARTEVYKCRGQNFYGQSNKKYGCLVPQEQFKAWARIKGQKSCRQELPMSPASDVLYDLRKEYARNKGVEGWKRLFVHKSSIHALGLFTKELILSGEMVVEYIGEIIDQQECDKREKEYLSGKNLLRKSACYFYEIDEEHIIDATCKGGIGRFVNHSCSPNVISKEIVVGNEKKIVFFANRVICAGEEITYDYKFNHEDEAKKIPDTKFSIRFSAQLVCSYSMILMVAYEKLVILQSFPFSNSFIVYMHLETRYLNVQYWKTESDCITPESYKFIFRGHAKRLRYKGL
ncbi:hypothetical protein ACFE04_017509 [Oxalis oulophora]